MPAARPLVSALVFLVLGLGVTASPAEPAAPATPEAENADRLRSMPHEERLALFEKLKEFDALSAAEKAAIRALNARIAQLPENEQANYWAVLRSYHRWVEGLTEEQRTELNSVPLSERMKMVTRLRAQERATAKASHLPLVVQVLDFAAMTPLETARRIKAWLEATPEQRAEIEKLDSTTEQQQRLNEIAQHVKMPAPVKIPKSDEEAIIAKIEASPQWKNSPLLNPLKKGDATKQEKVRRRIATSFHFLENPPAAVDPIQLMRFQAALPSWYRGQFDHLPADEARRRLTIYYRLIYPAPAEMPEIPNASVLQGVTTKPEPGPATEGRAGAETTPSRVPPPPKPGTTPF
jgi:hypothetical protein